MDIAFEWITEQPCDDCGRALQLIRGDLRCTHCDIDYSISSDIVYRKEVTN